VLLDSIDGLLSLDCNPWWIVIDSTFMNPVFLQSKSKNQGFLSRNLLLMVHHSLEEMRANA
jgi:hypothetical protein